jgi:DNA-directed RNA polymerase subunit RPC12/RpoP
MTYMYFSLFFIPVFKWGRRYYLRSSCCNTVYELDPELGRRLQKGEAEDVGERELHAVNMGHTYGNRCPYCGYPASPEFEYCPKCGRKLS